MCVLEIVREKVENSVMFSLSFHSFFGRSRRLDGERERVPVNTAALKQSYVTNRLKEQPKPNQQQFRRSGHQIRSPRGKQYCCVTVKYRYQSVYHGTAL